MPRERKVNEGRATLPGAALNVRYHVLEVIADMVVGLQPSILAVKRPSSTRVEHSCLWRTTGVLEAFCNSPAITPDSIGQGYDDAADSMRCASPGLGQKPAHLGVGFGLLPA